ncbi:MAG: preprotein translocase subunit SecA, partial [Patescibacteria group bacterium]
MKKAIKSILGDPEAKTLRRYRRIAKQINGLEDDIKKLSDAKLKAKTKEFQKRLGNESLDALLPEVYAVVREAASRVLGQRHYDVQLVGGIALHEGKVAELRTGEGKTLVATLPLYLNALSGKGAHLVTVNDYLAQIGAGWMAEIYHFLGMSIGVIIPDASFIYDPEYTDDTKDDDRLKHLRPCTRKEAYAADVTYGTNNEFGFDYLRDNMVRENEQLRQRELNYAIVDEVDSILIDEARTPLIISAPSVNSGTSYDQFARVAKQLKPEHFDKDEKLRSVVLTNLGVERVEKLLGIDNLYATENIRVIYHMEQALKAEALFTRDKDYVVTKDGEVVIVDDFTGRLLPGRRYNEGLHQAIEAKEGVEVQQESMTLAKISFQNLFRLYDKLSGMTGTAETERDEFYEIYKLDVVVVPTNKPVIRKDNPDAIYRSHKAKNKAIIERVKELNAKGQPVLLGTSSIENNEQLSSLLKKAGIKHDVLNAKNNTKEAAIVARAGQKGAVTLATNIAGRGTDIVLGDGIVDLGGLYVIGTERHESRRIDNQLRGRSGRQGDPGESQFFVSTEDDIMRIFNGDRIANLMDRLKVDEGVPIENRLVSKALEGAQKKVESFNFDSRKNVVQYDDVMNKHRLATYSLRKQLLDDVDISQRVKDLIKDESERLADLPGQDDEYEHSITHILPFDEQTLDRLFD